MSNTLYTVYSTDDNYAQHAGVSIVSLFENNKHFENIVVYIIDNEIKEENKKKLLSIGRQYGRTVEFIDFGEFKDKLHLNMAWNISLSSYARLFITSMLPQSIDRVLYYDCDTVIASSVDGIWNEDIEDYYVAAVGDTVPDSIKEAVGIPADSRYFNAGMLLINLKKWRESNIEQKFLDFINERGGTVIHHDQGVLNGVLNGGAKILPLEYNLMTIYYILERDKILKYYNVSGESYSSQEIENAKKHPVCLHYTPSFTSRPWVKTCKHPFKNLYWEYLEISPWKGNRPQKATDSWKTRLVDWRFRTLPF